MNEYFVLLSLYFFAFLLQLTYNKHIHEIDTPRGTNQL